MALDPNEPVSLALARSHARLDDATADDDSTLEQYILTARRRIETRTGHIMLRRTIVRSFPDFASISLREYPIAPDEGFSIIYLDTAGESQELEGFRPVTALRPCTVVSDTDWPPTSTAADAVQVNFVAGYVDPSEVPAELVQAITLLFTAFVKARAAIADQPTEDAIEYLIEDYRLRAFA